MPKTLRTYFSAVVIGLSVVALFAFHPSVNAYHTGFAGLLLSATFVAAVVTGAAGRRIYVLAALLVLAYLEPEVKVTNSLSFNVISNGLIVGAGWGLVSNKFGVPRTITPFLAAIGGLIVLALALPMIVDQLAWTHVYEALTYAQYGIMILLAASCTSRDIRWIAIALAASSTAVAMVAIAEAFHISWFDSWVYETYMAAYQYTPDLLEYMTTEYRRSHGLIGPIGTALHLSMSLGAWFVLMIRSQTTKQVAMFALGMNIVLLAIFLTGSRMGIVTAAPALAFGVLWWVTSGKSNVQYKTVAIVAAMVVLATVTMSSLNGTFRSTVDESVHRYSITVPGLVNGTPDTSFEERLEEYSEVQMAFYEFSPSRDSEGTSEYINLLKRYGLAGFLLVWLLWIMIASRATRAVSYGLLINDRHMGMMALVAVMTMLIGGIGHHSFTEASRMTILLLLTGLLPAVTKSRDPALSPLGFLSRRNKRPVRQIAT